MCRLFGFIANEPTQVECSLVHAINSLVAQSAGDLKGERHEHGWGVAEYSNGGAPHLEKQAWAAYHGEHFRKAAARIYSRIVIAHVRKATVGPPEIANTHPFSFGRWAFAHNGTVPNFDQVRDVLLDELDSLNRSEITGSTDSEFIFRLLLSRWREDPAQPLVEVLQSGLGRVVKICNSIDKNSPIGLNILWTDGTRLVGSRFGRTLWYLERDFTHVCQICGKTHVHHEPEGGYRAVEIASEPITNDERWIEVPNATIYAVDPDLKIHFYPFTAVLSGA